MSKQGGEQVSVVTTIDSERLIYAYGGSVAGEMFVLVVFRCPACGSTGMVDSWCVAHSAPPDAGDAFLKVKREPVLVPHANPEQATTEIYDRGTDHD